MKLLAFKGLSQISHKHNDKQPLTLRLPSSNLVAPPSQTLQCLPQPGGDWRASWFAHFDASMYEARWFMVVNFVSQAAPLLHILVEVWSEWSFTHGVSLSAPFPLLLLCRQ